jgi:predicted DNA-binding transcriptional regulator AlpA
MEWMARAKGAIPPIGVLVAISVDDPSSLSQTTSPASVLLSGYLRREELAQQFGLSTRTIDRWEALKEGPPRVSIGRTILYNVESVREWLSTREKRPMPRRKRRAVG